MYAVDVKNQRVAFNIFFTISGTQSHMSYPCYLETISGRCRFSFLPSKCMPFMCTNSKKRSVMMIFLISSEMFNHCGSHRVAHTGCNALIG